jgi:hypothetical protein
MNHLIKFVEIYEINILNYFELIFIFDLNFN